MILHLKQLHLNLLKDEVKNRYPIEACAMLLGELTDEEAIVKNIMLASNELKSTVRFKICPEKVVKTLNLAEREGLEFIGLFHSHPAPARPSAIDLKNMKYWGNIIWLILSSTDNQLAAFQMKKNELIKIITKIKNI